ncbi:flagellar FlbD family protein [Cellulomonas endophytica]|uniref:flagellar FlbD family protein n=1 Tax=Cellulomonas endophytica TaxID=2494735 RepID=UPI0010124422|nr:flagellar FlbD family protein [Cellulomonas endophytica]
MIVVTRLNGGQFGVNPDLVQRIDSAPDTILTLIDGTKYIVEESMAEVVDRVNEHRSQLLARAQEIVETPARSRAPGDGDGRDAPEAGRRADPTTPGADPRRTSSSDPHAEHLAPAVPLRPRSR